MADESLEMAMIEAQKRISESGAMDIKNPRVVEEDGLVYLYDGDRLIGFMNPEQYHNLVKQLSGGID